MHEMEGPARSHGTKPSVALLRCAIRPATRANDPPEVPVSRLFLRSEVSPGWSPFPVVTAFLRLIGYPAQEFAASILMIFWLSTRRPQDRHGYPPHRLFLHRLVHTFIHR